MCVDWLYSLYLYTVSPLSIVDKNTKCIVIIACCKRINSVYFQDIQSHSGIFIVPKNLHTTSSALTGRIERTFMYPSFFRIKCGSNSTIVLYSKSWQYGVDELSYGCKFLKKVPVKIKNRNVRSVGISSMPTKSVIYHRSKLSEEVIDYLSVNGMRFTMS